MPTKSLVCLIAGTLILNGSALALEPDEGQAGPSRHGAERSPLQPPDSNCREWTDGCRVCSRSEQDAIHCSNIGTACQQKDAVCTKPEFTGPAPGNKK
jgi:hypothetical protein